MGFKGELRRKVNNEKGNYKETEREKGFLGKFKILLHLTFLLDNLIPDKNNKKIIIKISNVFVIFKDEKKILKVSKQ